MLWVAGTFLFAVLFNWTINGRSILRMTPAVAILIARRLDLNSGTALFPFRRATLCTVIGGALALYVTEADCLTATAVRQNTRSIFTDDAAVISRLRFQGHWGFQFYMSELGASPLDFKSTQLKPGDLIAIPSNNTSILMPAPGKAGFFSEKRIREPGPPFLTTISETLGANFYASILGPLPYSFGIVPSEKVFIYSLQ